MEQPTISKHTKIFCTGAFLQPMEIEINGTKQWRWIVVGTEDSSYRDGKEVLIYDYADDLQGLMMQADD